VKYASQERRFARAVRANDRHEAARREFQRHACQRLDTVKRFTQTFATQC
jgi:hypothetical protein